MSINAFHSPPSQGGARGESEIKWIVIHCSATKLSQNFTKAKLWASHVKGNGWSDIGYHYYITKDGKLHTCRPEEKVGAHVKGFNQKSIGICYEGGIAEDGKHEDTRTAEQLVTMHNLLVSLKQKYPDAEIVGHRDLLQFRTKDCPCFDARRYYAYLNR